MAGSGRRNLGGKITMQRIARDEARVAVAQFLRTPDPAGVIADCEVLSFAPATRPRRDGSRHGAAILIGTLATADVKASTTTAKPMNNPRRFNEVFDKLEMGIIYVLNDLSPGRERGRNSEARTDARCFRLSSKQLKHHARHFANFFFVTTPMTKSSRSNFRRVKSQLPRKSGRPLRAARRES